jgi:hypothetical protein
MLEAVQAAVRTLKNPRSISDLIPVNHVPGKKEDVGFKYLPVANLSIQGQNANKAWLVASAVARATGVKLEVSFSWSVHPKAFRPGQTGVLTA